MLKRSDVKHNIVVFRSVRTFMLLTCMFPYLAVHLFFRTFWRCLISYLQKLESRVIFHCLKEGPRLSEWRPAEIKQ